MSNYADLDREDQQLLDSLKPEGAVPGTDPSHVPEDDGPAEGQDPDASAPAAPAADPAQAPAAPAPEATSNQPPAGAQPKPDAGPAPGDTSQPAPTPAPAPADQGDTRAALRAARAAERRMRNELAALRQELEELRAKAGNTTQPEADDYTDEQLEDLRENYPLQYRMVMELRALKEKVETTLPKAPAPAPEWQPPEFAPEVQEVIDQVPTLLAWQYSQADQQKFQMAAEFDASLLHHPDWKHRSPVERFQEAVRLTQARFAPAPAATPAPTPDPAATAAKRIEEAPAHAPVAIHDFRGGGPAAAPTVDFRSMSDEQILGSLVPEP